MNAQIRASVLTLGVAATATEAAGRACEAIDLPTTALVRIWLIDQSKGLRLVASAGRPVGGGSYHQINAASGIVRDDGSKIARIAATGEAMIVRGVRGDEPWLENPGWVARQGIRSFVGLPIAAEAQVLGVMILFDRNLTSDATIDDLRFLSDVLAVRCRHLRDVANASSAPLMPAASPASIVTRGELRAIEKRSIETALAATRGKVFGADGAAALLAMKPTTLISRMKALGIRP